MQCLLDLSLGHGNAMQRISEKKFCGAAAVVAVPWLSKRDQLRLVAGGKGSPSLCNAMSFRLFCGAMTMPRISEKKYFAVLWLSNRDQLQLIAGGKVSPSLCNAMSFRLFTGLCQCNEFCTFQKKKFVVW